MLTGSSYCIYINSHCSNRAFKHTTTTTTTTTIATTTTTTTTALRLLHTQIYLETPLLCT
jgi:hypothetical protein